MEHARPAADARITRVSEADLPELLPLMRGYCDFYDVTPSDDDLLALSRALLASPQHEGIQLIARNDDGAAVGFATVYWTWSTLKARRVGVMNDLFLAEHARGRGAAEALIAACVDLCREHGAAELSWQTATDNHRAQALYDRVGGKAEQWVDYSLPVDSPA